MAEPQVIVLMGVAGSGKTTIGEALGQRWGATFADGDDFHPAANRVKMAAGTPLDDADRAPWLASLNGLLRGWVEQGQRGVLACSALKASYRSTLGEGLPAGAFALVWLDAPKATLEDRLAHRHHAFMNPHLLDSQLATLEPPADAMRIVNDRTPEAVVEQIVTALGLTR